MHTDLADKLKTYTKQEELGDLSSLSLGLSNTKEYEEYLEEEIVFTTNRVLQMAEDYPKEYWEELLFNRNYSFRAGKLLRILRGTLVLTSETFHNRTTTQYATNLAIRLCKEKKRDSKGVVPTSVLMKAGDIRLDLMATSMELKRAVVACILHDRPREHIEKYLRAYSSICLIAKPADSYKLEGRKYPEVGDYVLQFSFPEYFILGGKRYETSSFDPIFRPLIRYYVAGLLLELRAFTPEALTRLNGFIDTLMELLNTNETPT